MQPKSLLIAIAAFAVTATGVHAYSGSPVINRAGLTKVQKNAIEKAQELRTAGDYIAARDRLVAAGITDDHLRAMHRAASETKNSIHEAIVHKDYEAFRKATIGLPIADIVTSEADFKQFCEAHELRDSKSEVVPGVGMMRRPRHFENLVPTAAQFTEEQREALRVARQSNDRATMQAIFDEAGFEYRHSKDE
ncbi:hypothetical protein GW937_00840 [Candidatus Kaiserbacteria bacterium]|nr:hypothetical protein [Candidatus Kaiserbacteria bacterium]NCT01656.1 hypothetical protein [Candidatus Parcubacteria bacterium]